MRIAVEIAKWTCIGFGTAAFAGVIQLGVIKGIRDARKREAARMGFDADVIIQDFDDVFSEQAFDVDAAGDRD